VKRFLDRIKPGRRIDANSAVLLPFTRDGKPDYDEFQTHLLRTAKAGITPAVNMDTGFGPQLTPAQRVEVLTLTRKALGSAPFIAGAGPFGETYEQAVKAILDAGATPIIFQSEQFASGDVAALYRKILAPCPKGLAFELGRMFAPFGRIYDLETWKRLLAIPNLVGAKHSSLSRTEEMVSSTLLTLIVIPAVYSLWKERELRLASRSVPPSPAPTGLPGTFALSGQETDP
jgi:dihydrodipicolinate synthase/N-acetylneuraminate lyase